MKRHFIACCMIGLCAGALAACNDFENPAVPYDEAPETQLLQGAEIETVLSRLHDHARVMSRFECP